jgi:hypothetical protein
MGAETLVYVLVQKVHEEWIEVSAVTLEEAKERARDQRGVMYVVDATYDRPAPQEGRDAV